jgi:hypothetical protein
MVLSGMLETRNRIEQVAPRQIKWTEYLKYRARTRGYDLQVLEQIVRHSIERYYDTATLRMAAVGKHDKRLVVVPYDSDENSITPVTVHAVTRPQVNLRIKTGRFVHE